MMEKKKYSEELVKQIQAKQYVTQMNGMEVIVKPIPDCEEAGMMDPRLYHDNKKMAAMMKLLPKSMMKMDASPKSIERLRKMFNGVKSVPVASDAIEVQKRTIKGKDGNELPIQIYLPIERKEKLPVLYYLHGGGFFAGHMGVVDQLVKMVVEKFNILAIAIDYRLAPENPYPKGHEDCYEGLKWVAKHIGEYGGDRTNIFVAGDSAGGNLTQYCTTRDKEDGTHMVKGQILLYPTVNMGGIADEYSKWSLDRYQINPKHEKVIKPSLMMMAGEEGMMNLLGEILGTTDVLNPYLTPYGMDVTGMVPTYISVGEHDALKVECLAYARKLKKAGVEVRCVIYKGMGHAYGDNVGVYPQSEDCAIEIGNFIMAHQGEVYEKVSV